MGTFVGWLALVIGLGLAAYVWKLHQELSIASRRLDRYNRALFDTNDQIRRLQEELATSAAQLRAELRRGQGQLAVSPDTSVREIQALHPEAQAVLAGFHLGGCSSCAVNPDDSLVAACTEHGVDVNQVLGALNLLVQPDSDDRVNHEAVQRVKLPNVKLEF